MGKLLGNRRLTCLPLFYFIPLSVVPFFSTFFNRVSLSNSMAIVRCPNAVWKETDGKWFKHQCPEVQHTSSHQKRGKNKSVSLGVMLPSDLIRYGANKYPWPLQGMNDDCTLSHSIQKPDARGYKKDLKCFYLPTLKVWDAWPFSSTLISFPQNVKLLDLITVALNVGVDVKAN